MHNDDFKGTANVERMEYDYTNHYKKYLDAITIQLYEDPEGHPIMSHYKTEVNRLFRGETI